jgi:mannose-6-phosphate isomerase
MLAKRTLAFAPRDAARSSMTVPCLIQFEPVYQQRVWGGRALEELFGRNLPDAAPYGESWEISARPEAPSVVRGGPLAGATLQELWSGRRALIFGEGLASHPAPRFPLLLKILDAADDLSIQVHPPAGVAEELGGEPKTEMWFVAAAREGARIYAGLKPGVGRAELERAIAEGAVADCAHVLEPRTGDALFIPSGRMHAIGAGLVIFEIQQNSDTTYRVFDWNRLGLDGQPRELHVRESLASIDFDDCEPSFLPCPENGEPLVGCEHFMVWHRHAARESSRTLAPRAECRLLACLRGGIRAPDGAALKEGDFALAPAFQYPPLFEVEADSEWLEVAVPPR